MAIFKCIKVKKYNLGELLKYVTKVDKTKDELVYAKDCSVETAKYEFEFVKKLYNKKIKDNIIILLNLLVLKIKLHHNLHIKLEKKC